MLQSRIQKSTPLAMDWLWGCRNVDYGWADHAVGPSAASNTCEIITGMQRCGLTYESPVVKESVGYVVKQLQDLGRNIVKETRNLSLPIVLLGDLGLKKKGFGLEGGTELLKKYQRSEGGWPLRPQEETCNAFDTSFERRALHPHDGYSKEMNQATSYVVKKQNNDGGWGFYHGTPSNPACTAHVLLGLLEADLGVYPEVMKKAAIYLSEKQLSDGSWEICWEEDPMHNHDKWFHFTAPWATIALSNNKINAPISRIGRAIEILIRSQEETGGWRVLEGYDPFTWATGNALMALSIWFKP